MLILLYSFFLPFATTGVCVSGGFSETTAYSTYFTRLFHPRECAGLTPCHVYLTVPEIATNSVFINFMISTDGCP